MNKSDLEKLSKSQLIKLLLKRQKKNKHEIIIIDDTKPSPKPRRPIPTPRKSVKQMVLDYEDNIILPPQEFRDGYIPVPLPRTKKPVPLPRTKKPVPMPTIKIEQTDKALKGYTKSYEINIKNNKDPLMQLHNTRKAVANHIENILISMKGLKFVETLKVTFTKMPDEEIVYKTAYFNSSVQTIINNTEIDESLQVSKQNILNKIGVPVGQLNPLTIIILMW